MDTSGILRCCIWLCLLFVCVTCFETYKVKIPNGNNVPHPCRDNHLWKGVGHRLQVGGGTKNPFGEDFLAAGKKWTKELCGKDSDGDGKTNGEELGDPGCVWNESDERAPIITGLSHPGVCEPLTDIKCKDQLDWLVTQCEEPKLNCNATKEPGVKKTTLQFPPTQVPAQETTYMCMEFNLDTSDDFHMIATEAIINNTNVMHHAVLFGCKSDKHAIRNIPHQCGMTASRECNQILSIWTLGSPGECFHDKVGFRIGTNGIKRVALQFHWNNPGLKSDKMDQSGMILHYTNNRRENDAGVLTIGAGFLEIPPRTSSVERTSVCPGSCTSNFLSDSIFVVSAFNHMHYLGISQKIEVFRNGTKLLDITSDEKYNYDSPIVHDKRNPIELKPGDTLSTTCVFNSQNRDTITYYGDATSDEMCFGFITYYPKSNNQADFCTAWKSMPYCELFGQYEPDRKFKGCSVSSFQTLQDDSIFQFSVLPKVCNASCTNECKDELVKMHEHPCLVQGGDLRDYFYYRWSVRTTEGKALIQLLKTCFPQTTTAVPIATDPTTTEPAATDPTTTEPAATDQTTTEPVATDPTTTEPVATDPTATKPTATEPVSSGNRINPSRSIVIVICILMAVFKL